MKNHGFWLAKCEFGFGKTQKLGVLSIMPKIPEISVGIQMERFVSVFSDRNIRDHLWRCPHISVRILRPKFAFPFMANQFFALIWEFGKRIQNNNSHFYWLARFNRKMSFHFPQVFPPTSDRSVWHNGSTHYSRILCHALSPRAIWLAAAFTRTSYIISLDNTTWRRFPLILARNLLVFFWWKQRAFWTR